MLIKMLPACDGDCFLLTYQHDGHSRHILIDGGPGRTHRALRQEISKIQERNEVIELLIITHIDDDHIGGVLKLFEDPAFDAIILKRIWFNSGALLAEKFSEADAATRELKLYPQDDVKISVRQGNTLEGYLAQLACWDKELIHTGLAPFTWNGLTVTVLSPTYQGLERLHQHWPVVGSAATPVSGHATDYARSVAELSSTADASEDKAVCNGSSIAILLEVAGQSFLFLGDAHPSVVAASLERLGYSAQSPLDAAFVKIAHHGSRFNTNDALLKLWRCQHYAISTDGAKHGLPNKECLAKIISASDANVKLYFNYPIVLEKAIFSARDYENYSFKCIDVTTTNYTIILT